MIQILPDHIANRIAAGEVVQRPASVVKELLENAVDAGATQISLVIEDAGRSLIQLVDNGCGMTPKEARIAFERHATSKISQVEDLDCIETFGFRGEALAAVAAVADLTLKTRKKEEETGIQLHIRGGQYIDESDVSCQAGANFEVRNLFFNMPARRKFLKSDASEFKHIVNAFTQMALCRCSIEFSLIHNGEELYHLPPTPLKQRIMRLLGKEMNQELVDFKVNSSVVNVSGYIGKPDNVRKSYGNQFFFINGRFFKSAYFQRSVLNAYQGMIPENSWPSWCIFMEVDPREVDVNIHPAKTEVKIENEQMIFQILQASVKEALGKNALGPSIDFDMEGAPLIPPLQRGLFAPPPKIDFDPLFNPFNEDRFNKPLLYDTSPEIFASPLQIQTQQPSVCLLKGKYLLTPVKSGLLLVHLQRARQRVCFEHYVHLISAQERESQQSIFPQEYTINPASVLLFQEWQKELLQMGFDIRPAGKEHVAVYGLPVGYSTENDDIAQMIQRLATQLDEQSQTIRLECAQGIALALALSEAPAISGPLQPEEAMQFIGKLFACGQPAISPLGKPCMRIISMEEIDHFLN
ncbi:MAG: DNA mismatch repair endonuclease MutL [Bacteroidetes bacterium]|nr:DNA mismatch repair endonuclease MutL [Bacteroidota bacterium]